MKYTITWGWNWSISQKKLTEPDLSKVLIYVTIYYKIFTNLQLTMELVSR